MNECCNPKMSHEREWVAGVPVQGNLKDFDLIRFYLQVTDILGPYRVFHELPRLVLMQGAMVMQLGLEAVKIPAPATSHTMSSSTWYASQDAVWHCWLSSTVRPSAHHLSWTHHPATHSKMIPDLRPKDGYPFHLVSPVHRKQVGIKLCWYGST